MKNNECADQNITSQPRQNVSLSSAICSAIVCVVTPILGSHFLYLQYF